jgi:hypothetical protein
MYDSLQLPGYEATGPDLIKGPRGKCGNKQGHEPDHTSDGIRELIAPKPMALPFRKKILHQIHIDVTISRIHMR